MNPGALSCKGPRRLQIGLWKGRRAPGLVPLGLAWSRLCLRPGRESSCLDLGGQQRRHGSRLGPGREVGSERAGLCAPCSRPQIGGADGGGGGALQQGL